MDSLINTGVACLRPADEGLEERTLVVVGVARGGTSIVSGVLQIMGVFMGDHSRPPVVEDLRLSLAFEGESEESFEEVIADYNGRNQVWGWKRPSTLHDLRRVAAALRNPHFIFVFRDLLSIANRNAISMSLKLERGLKMALKDYGTIVEFIAESEAPALLVSSEKVTRNKDVLLSEICRFASLSPSESQLEEAREFISPDPLDYLDKTRNTRSRGKIDPEGLHEGILRGWAKSMSHDSPVSVDVIVDDEAVGSVIANSLCEESRGPRAKGSDHCGFHLDLKAMGVRPGSEIRARVKGDVKDLRNSPASYPAEVHKTEGS